MAVAVSSESVTERVKDIADDHPCQPHNIHFPSRSFGKTKPVNQSFQSSWFKKFQWLHYDSPSDSAFCYICYKATKQRKVRISGIAEDAFIIKGSTNWKDATRVFSKHDASEFHKQALESLKNIADVGEMLSSQHHEEKSNNRDNLMKVLTTLRYLACQGLALRGDNDEIDSNLHRLLILRAEDCPTTPGFLTKKKNKFTSHEIQNELVSLMAQQILH